MKFITWIKGMMDAESSISSKRFCGVLGWLVSIAVIIYCTVAVIQAPTIMEFFILSVVGLLGVDSVTGIWKKAPCRLDKAIKDNSEQEETVIENDTES